MLVFRALNENTQAVNFQAYADALSDLGIFLQAGDAVQQEIKDARFRLDIYGLTASRKYSSSIKDMVCAFDNSLGTAWWLLKLLTDDADLRYQANMPPLRYNTLNFPAIKLALRKAETAAGIETQYLSFTEHLDKMMGFHTAIFSQRLPIGKLFRLRK